jgi:hypothetical protein
MNLTSLKKVRDRARKASSRRRIMSNIAAMEESHTATFASLNEWKRRINPLSGAEVVARDAVDSVEYRKFWQQNASPASTRPVLGGCTHSRPEVL